jgi:transcriptional regulator with XRE-family HTH domain
MQRARRKQSLSYAAIAKRAEVDPSQVSRICRGEFVTLGGSVMRICTVLKVPVRSTDASPPRVFPRNRPADAAWKRLERSMRRAWDETPAGADKLAKILSAVAEIARR